MSENNKYVSFIFDDGFQTEYLYALPLFNKYNVKACTAVISNKIDGYKDETNEKHLSLEELNELQKNGWEILSHTRTHKDLTLLSLEEVEEELEGSKKDLMSLGFEVNNLVYPLHKQNLEIQGIAKKYYRSGRAGTQTPNVYPINIFYNLNSILIDDLKLLVTYNRNFQIKQNSWIIFYCHLCKSKIIKTSIEERLQTVESLIVNSLMNNYNILTVNEVLNEHQRTSR